MGRLGGGFTAPSPGPVTVLDLEDITDISVGVYHACAITDNKTAWCWGDRNGYNLGDGKEPFARSPVNLRF
jgi:alpha-tubulin suppressor-like RCC1 family protein